MLIRAATVVQVLQDLIVLSFIAYFILLVIVPLTTGYAQLGQISKSPLAIWHDLVNWGYPVAYLEI